jgi:hypothetical protein
LQLIWTLKRLANEASKNKAKPWWMFVSFSKWILKAFWRHCWNIYDDN